MTENNGPDLSALAADMLRWEQMKRQLDALEQAIEDTVLALGKTQTVGNVRASYSGGRKSYDYETAGWAAPPDILADYTTETVVTKTDWKMVCDVAGIEDIPFTQSPPSVSLKLL